MFPTFFVVASSSRCRRACSALRPLCSASNRATIAEKINVILKFAKPALDLNFFLQHRELAPRELELAFDDADLALAVLARLRAELTENLPDRIAHDAVAILTTFSTHVRQGSPAAVLDVA